MSKKKNRGKPAAKAKALRLSRETIKDLTIKPLKGGVIRGGGYQTSVQVSGIRCGSGT